MTKKKKELPQSQTDRIQRVTDDLIEVELRRINGESVGITQAIRDIAEKNGATIASVRNRYYNNVKDKFNDQSNDSNPLPPSKVKSSNTTTAKEKQMELTNRSTHVPYKAGELIEVVVAKVLENVGAICKTTDENEVQGLVHISRIADAYVDSVKDYFTEGEVLKARVTGINQRGELELSTKGLKNINEKSKIDPKEFENSTLSEKLLIVRQELITEQENQQVALLKKITNEEDKIMKYLNGIVGAVTPAAREELFNVIEEHGIFAFTLKMTEVAKDFTNDLGLLFIKQVQEKIKGEGL